MNCRKVTHLLSAYIDGELPGVESLQIRDHINWCSDCASEYHDLLSMKRLVGRLKIQEPANDIAGDILQNIRIETELLAERSPMVRFRQFTSSLRSAFAAPRILGLGFGVAAVAALLYSQSLSGNQVQVVGTWDHSIPSAREFTSGVSDPTPNRFISSAFRGSGSPNGIEHVSFEPGIPEFRQSPSQFGAGGGYFSRTH